MKLSVPCPETPAEQLANVVTHGVGLVLSVVALASLIVIARVHGDPRRLVTVGVYGLTLMLMYTASTCYHCVRSPRARYAMRVFDHATIFLLIAGTYTPIALVGLGGRWGWSLFGVVWGLAAVGIVAKVFFVGRYEALSVTLYVLMGWLALVALKPLIAVMPAAALGWIFGGGLVYTAGVGFYLWDRLPFNHAIWHLFVLAGSACHFTAVLLYVLPVSRVVG